MKRFVFSFGLFLISFVGFSQVSDLNFRSFRSYSFPTELVNSKKGDKIAWAMDEKGVRNIYVASAPNFVANKITNFTKDEGQELTSISISDDGKWVVFVRGGDHGANFNGELSINTNSTLEPLSVKIIQIPFEGGSQRIISDGDFPKLSPNSEQVAFIKNNQAWICKLDTVSGEDFFDLPRQLITTKGKISDLQWSPDGKKIAFKVDRDSHSFIGIMEFSNDYLTWIDPSFARDSSPRWSPDGKKIAFVRLPAIGGTLDSLSQRKLNPWSIRISDFTSQKSQLVWEAPRNFRGSFPRSHGGANLMFPQSDVITFTSSHDNWPHIYSISSKGGKPVLLTPGDYMVEHLTLNNDKNHIFFSANYGLDTQDIDRRHVFMVAVNKPEIKSITQGNGNEWSGIGLNSAQGVAYIGSNFQKSPQVFVQGKLNSEAKSITGKYVPNEYLENKFVNPSQVIFKSLDGQLIHGQVFDNGDGKTQKPAILFVHGGPARQMLLGWHYSDYYANTYALNQYLANLGFVVLSVNYRLGIGYGYDFQNPASPLAATEYYDIKAAGEWLAKQSNINPKKIGIYGGSYGGYLTALALGRDSKLFTVGVDIHGVHDWSTNIQEQLYTFGNKRVPDAEWAASLVYRSSPISSINTWTSPVLIIHSDDDRNVRFEQSIDLINRLQKKKVEVESMVIVDDTHHWMKFENVINVFESTANFLKAHLLK
jgi:dipeptidyl aminopeptidase/acylaminoacyl peptidase